MLQACMGAVRMEILQQRVRTFWVVEIKSFQSLRQKCVGWRKTEDLQEIFLFGGVLIWNMEDVLDSGMEVMVAIETILTLKKHAMKCVLILLGKM